MTVLQENNDKKGNFYIEDNGHRIAGMFYNYANPHLMIIEHTEVDEAYGGKGLGKELLKELISYVRAHDIKVIPLCPFAKKMIDKMPEYGDVLPEQR